MTESVILDLKKLVESKEKDYGQHIIIGIEVSEEGVPMGIVLKVKGSPVMTLGMLELVAAQLEEAREQAYAQLDEIQEKHMTRSSTKPDGTREVSGMNVDDIIKDFSAEDLPFLEDMQKRARAAMESMDKEELDRILAEMKEYKKRRQEGSGGDEDFDIEDFKGGF